MSPALYKLGRLAARHPWRVIGAWLLVAVIVVATSGAFGRELEDTQEAPGLDSQKAVELLSRVQSDQAGLTAQVVLTPSDDTLAFFDSADARAAVAHVQTALAGLPDLVAPATPPAPSPAAPARPPTAARSRPTAAWPSSGCSNR